MDLVSIASVVVAAFAAVSAYLAQRTASRTASSVAHGEQRVDMEKEAYVRARAHDVATIERQDAEIAKLRQQMEELRVRESKLQAQVTVLRGKVAKLEEAALIKPQETLNESFTIDYDNFTNSRDQQPGV